MTHLLGHRGDKEPFICGICARAASSVGYMTSDRHPIMWLCEDSVCISQAKWVYDMKTKDLKFWEQRAIDAASLAVTDSLIEAVMTMLWERQIHSLDEIDGPRLAEISQDANEHRKLHSVLTNFLLEYSGALKKELDGREVPF